MKHELIILILSIILFITSISVVVLDRYQDKILRTHITTLKIENKELKEKPKKKINGLTVELIVTP